MIKNLKHIGSCCWKWNLSVKELIADFEILNMSCQRHLDDFTCGCIIRRLGKKRHIIDVAMKFHITYSVVSWLWRAFQRTGMCSKCYVGGCLHSIIAIKDRYIVQSGERDRCTTACQVANQILVITSKRTSWNTVARTLDQGGLHA